MGWAGGDQDAGAREVVGMDEVRLDRFGDILGFNHAPFADFTIGEGAGHRAEHDRAPPRERLNVGLSGRV